MSELQTTFENTVQRLILFYLLGKVLCFYYLSDPPLFILFLLLLFPVVCHDKDAEEAVDDGESHDQRVEAVAELLSETITKK